MKIAKLPDNELARLQSLKELKILDTQLEESYDELTKLVSQICEVPISLISLLDEKRQWFKSRHGLSAESTPREYAFCAHTILENNIFEISDSRKDERFFDNPLVTGAPNVIFYAGTQLTTPNGLNLGTLCVIDHKPKKLNKLQRDALEIIGRQISNQFELRRSLFQISKQDATEAALALTTTFRHEINNPLTIVKGLLGKSKDSIDSTTYDKLNHATDRIINIVKDVSDTLEENGLEYEDYCNKDQKIKIG